MEAGNYQNGEKEFIIESNGVGTQRKADKRSGNTGADVSVKDSEYLDSVAPEASPVIVVSKILPHSSALLLLFLTFVRFLLAVMKGVLIYLVQIQTTWAFAFIFL